MEALEECAKIAPLHNPPNIQGIEACQKIMPNVPQVGVFDTAFHQTMPAEAFLYGLPYEAYTDLGVRRYGFHGTSHKYVAQRVAELMGKHMSDLRIVSCHLGNGLFRYSYQRWPFYRYFYGLHSIVWFDHGYSLW